MKRKINYLLAFLSLFLTLTISLIDFPAVSWTNSLAIKNSNLTINYNNLSKVKNDFRFTDVPLGNVARDDIIWAFQYGLVQGYSLHVFGSSNQVSRGQMAIFLYNVAGRPDFTPQANPFYDINSSTIGYEQILWLAQNGITAGYTPTEYKPDYKVTRQQMALFLYRLSGVEYNVTSCGFTDISRLHDGFKQAICYLKYKAVTAGTTATTFSPSGKTTRQQMTTFIHRTSDNILQNDIVINQMPDILLGTFFSNETNPYNAYLYTSVDGIHFDDPKIPDQNPLNINTLQPQNISKQGRKIFTDNQETMLKNIIINNQKLDPLKVSNNKLSANSNNTVNPYTNFRDPAILYKDGYFWIIGTIGGVQGNLGFWLTYSSNLQTFSNPQVIKNINIPDGVPTYSGNWTASWAPAIYSENNQNYIILSAGDPDNYMVQTITPCSFIPNDNQIGLSPATVTCQSSQLLNIPGATAPNSSECNLTANYQGKIDGHITKTDSTYYLTDKPNGHCPNEMFASDNIFGPYTKVNNNIVDSNKWGTHTDNGDQIYKTLEGSSSVYFQNKFIAYPDNFRDVSPGIFDGDVQYIISGSEQFNADTIPKKVIAPRKLRHGEVVNFAQSDAKQKIYALRNGLSDSNNNIFLNVWSNTTRPDNSFIQNQTGLVNISVTNNTANTITKVVRYTDTNGHDIISNQFSVASNQTIILKQSIASNNIGNFTGQICFWDTVKSLCESELMPYYSSSVIANSSQTVGILGVVWADKVGKKSIKVQLSTPEIDGGWPIIQYKVELERYKKPTIIKYISPDNDIVYFEKLANDTYWAKLTAITSFGTSPRHVRSCAYGSKANCDDPIIIS